MREQSEGVEAGTDNRVARDGFAAMAVLVLAVVFIAIVVSQVV